MILPVDVHVGERVEGEVEQLHDCTHMPSKKDRELEVITSDDDDTERYDPPIVHVVSKH